MNIKAEQKQKVTLPSPLFRDPIYDCPTDPTVIWNEKEEQWYLLYTQRRATDVPIGVSWVHGTALGVATSRDGTKWLYRGTLEGLDIEPGHNTFWAPEIIEAEGLYHTMSPTSPAFQTIGSIRDGCCIILRQTSGTGDLKDRLISIPSA